MPGESQILHDPDDDEAEVDLPPGQAMAGGVGECVVVVVPSLAEAEDSENEIVSAVVKRVKRPLSPDVTDGVDAPGDMVDQEDADKSAPEQAEERTGPGPADKATQRSREEQAHKHPQFPTAADAAKNLISLQVADVAGESGVVGGEHPADMGVGEALEEPTDAVAGRVRGMWVFELVAVLMMSAMDSHPSKQRSLDSHGAEDGENGADGRVSFEGAVREEAMVSDGDSEPGGQIHADEQCDFRPIDAGFPEPDEAINERGERQ